MGENFIIQILIFRVHGDKLMLDTEQRTLLEGDVMVDIQFKVEKGRVLVPVGIPCPFGCKYCYTRNGEVGPARVKPAEILSHLQEFATLHSFNTIQFSY